MADNLFSGKMWDRTRLATADAAWDALPVAERCRVLQMFKLLQSPPGQMPADVPAEALPDHALGVLRAADVLTAADTAGRRVKPTAPLGKSFFARFRSISVNRLLDAHATPMRYVNENYVTYAATAAFDKVLQRRGLDGVGLGELVDKHMPTGYWGDWVAEYLAAAAKKQRAAAAPDVLKVLREADGPVPLFDLPARVGGRPEDVFHAVDGLTAYMAVVEGLDLATGRVVVGVPPAARAHWRKHQPRAARPMPAAVEVVAVAPYEGWAVPDLRSVLIGLAGNPARVKQDGAVYVKDVEQMAADLLGWPDWTSEETPSPFERAEQAVRRAGHAAWTELHSDRKTRQQALEVSAEGRRWLTLGAGEQALAALAAARGGGRDSAFGYNYGTYALHDEFGIEVVALELGGSKPPNLYNIRRVALEPFVRALRSAFELLPVGGFVPLGAFVDHVTAGPANPVLLGRTIDRVAVYHRHTRVAPVPPALADAGRDAMLGLAHKRLIPFGVLHAGRAADGSLCVARTGLLGRFFDPKAKVEATASAPVAEARVVVQPDFTVTVIGPNPTPAADLALFCERKAGPATPGLVQFTITRQAVVKAASRGLTAQEMLRRLDLHASTAVPANVRTEIRTWAGTVRYVQVEEMSVVRCRDAETAERVRGALGSSTERLGTTVVGVRGPITPALRLKLQQAGVFVGDAPVGYTPPPADAPAPKKAKAKKAAKA